jgi:hypothetical protein
MSTISQFFGGSGSVIKSIQRGLITISGAATSATATLSPAVTTSKAMLMNLGSNAVDFDVRYQARLTLTNSTTVTATRVGTGTDTFVSWQVVEYE